MTDTELPTPGPVPEEVVASFEEHADTIMDRTVEASLQSPDATARLGPQPEATMRTGLRFTTDGLVTAMSYGTTDLLDDQLQWAMGRLPHDGVPPTDLLERLRLYRDAIADVLPDHHAAHVIDYVDWMIARMQQLMTRT